jgi:hypothetical protein
VELQQLEEALREILAGLQEAIQAREFLSEEFQEQIGQTIDALTNRIDELRSENPVEGLQPTSETPQLEPGPFPSSNVNAFKYNPKTQQLFVKFHGKDSADSGPVYGYQNVPQNIYDVFAQGRVGPKTSGQNQYHRWIKGVTPSLGASLNALIKEGGYPYQRMS